jgi:hypothetical protein
VKKFPSHQEDYKENEKRHKNKYNEKRAMDIRGTT